MQVLKDETYKKFADKKNVDYIFNYILTEYHCQPNEILFYESKFATAEEALKEAFSKSDREVAKRVIDDFFCDVYQSKRKMWNYIEACSLDPSGPLAPPPSKKTTS